MNNNDIVIHKEVYSREKTADGTAIIEVYFEYTDVDFLEKTGTEYNKNFVVDYKGKDCVISERKIDFIIPGPKELKVSPGLKRKIKKLEKKESVQNILSLIEEERQLKLFPNI